MKLKTYSFLVVTFAILSSCCVASAQEPSTPAPTSHNVPTFVCLKQDYVDALKPSGVVRENQIVAVFVRFDSDFAVFKRPDSLALIYIPKTAILYISGKPDPQVKF